MPDLNYHRTEAGLYAWICARQGQDSWQAKLFSELQFERNKLRTKCEGLESMEFFSNLPHGGGPVEP